jgi:putative endonuclease
MDKQSFVYIITNHKEGTLYVGVTSHLVQRIWQHREGIFEGFSKQYHLKTLVWYETHEEIEHAIHREKRLKKYTRAQKLRLIQKRNPEWNDLYETITS